MIEHIYKRGDVVYELADEKRVAGFVTGLLALIEMKNPDAKAKAAYYVRFADGRKKIYAENELVAV